MNINEINAGSLAYVGDAIYELIIRKYLISIKLNNVNKLQNEAIKYVSAKAQAKFLDKIIDANILTKEELSTVSRARNYKPNSKPKNTDIKTYKKATALEALFGMLYLLNNKDRLKIITKEILG